MYFLDCIQCSICQKSRGGESSAEGTRIQGADEGEVWGGGIPSSLGEGSLEKGYALQNIFDFSFHFWCIFVY